jgi:hypothetical protein
VYRRPFLAALGALTAGCNAAGDAAPTQTPTAASTPAPTPPDTTHVVGETFRIADETRPIRIVVDGVETTATAGGPDGEPAADGLALVALTIRNDGYAGVNVSPGAFALLDGRGRTHGVAETATAALDDGLLLVHVPPGRATAGVVAFDVPADSRPWTLRIDPARLFVAAPRHYVSLSGTRSATRR